MRYINLRLTYLLTYPFRTLKLLVGQREGRPAGDTCDCWWWGCDWMTTLGYRPFFSTTRVSWYPDFIGAQDDGDSGDSWSCKSCKAPVKSSPSTNQCPAFYWVQSQEFSEFFTFLPLIQLNPTHPSDHTHFRAIQLQWYTMNNICQLRKVSK